MSRVRLGMTLIELLIGIVITGAAVSAGYATFSTLVDQQQRAKFVVDNVSRGAAIRRQLPMWIQDGNIALINGNVSRNGLNLSGQGMQGELRLFTLSSTPVDGPSLITLYVNLSNPRYPRGLLAEFASLPGMNNLVNNSSLDTIVVPIDSTITGMRVEYFIDRGNRVRQWLTAEEIGNAGGAPLAVRLWFVSDDPTRLTPLLRLPLTVAFTSR